MGFRNSTVGPLRHGSQLSVEGTSTLNKVELQYTTLSLRSVLFLSRLSALKRYLLSGKGVLADRVVVFIGRNNQG